MTLRLIARTPDRSAQRDSTRTSCPAIDSPPSRSQRLQKIALPRVSQNQALDKADNPRLSLDSYRRLHAAARPQMQRDRAGSADRPIDVAPWSARRLALQLWLPFWIRLRFNRPLRIDKCPCGLRE